MARVAVVVAVVVLTIRTGYLGGAVLVVLNYFAVQTLANAVGKGVARVVAFEAASSSIRAQQTLIRTRSARIVFLVLLVHAGTLVWIHLIVHGEGRGTGSALTRKVVKIRMARCAVGWATHKYVGAFVIFAAGRICDIVAEVVCLQPVSFGIGAITCVVVPVVAVRVHAGCADSCSHFALFAVVRIALNAIVYSVVIGIIWTCYNVNTHVGIYIQELSIHARALFLWLYQCVRR